MRGELLEADAVAREWQDILRQLRAGVLAVTSQVRSRLPHLTPADADVIDREIRDALTVLGHGDDDDPR